MRTENKKAPGDSPQMLGDFVVPSYVPNGTNTLLVVIKWGKIIVVALLLAAVGLGLWGHSRWLKKTQGLVHALEQGAAAPAARSQRYDDSELATLPPVVRRYLSQVLNPNQPLVRKLYLEQSGTFNRSSTPPEIWDPFTAKQLVVTKRPGFVWDASILMLPGVSVRVVDAYVAGVGTLQPSVIGLFDLGGMQGTGEIARGELIRYMAESVWYPTALLPSQGMQWKAVDANTAQATFTDGPITVSLLFSFNASGLVERISSTERSALVDGSMVSMPWEVRLSHYQAHSGMLVPQQAEVAWLAPAGRLPYWRGKIEKLDYEMPR